MGPSRLLRPFPRARAALLIAGLLLLAIGVFDALIDGPLRRVIERRMNERLHGYSIALRAVDLSPWTLSLDLVDLIVVQQAHPRPPVAGFPRVTFSVQWRSLLSGRIVGDARLEGPRLYVNLEQLREERADPVALDERGWQDAVRAAYPLEINELRVVGGSLVYSHRDPDRPLRLSDIELLAANIRNIESPERRYPSPIRGTARVFEDGRLAFAGQADFLAEPHAGMRARLRLEDVPLERLDPLSRQVRLFST